MAAQSTDLETMKAKLDSYTLRVVCFNCDWRGWVTMAKGVEFSSYTKPCERCGCYRLRSL